MQFLCANNKKYLGNINIILVELLNLVTTVRCSDHLETRDDRYNGKNSGWIKQSSTNFGRSPNEEMLIFRSSGELCRMAGTFIVSNNHCSS